MSERSISPFERYGSAFPLTDAAVQVYTFKVTDTLSGLAQKFYGDWRLWRDIADRNNLIDVRAIEPGTQLIIPRLALQTGSYESL